MKLTDLEPGDKIAGFENFGCIPDRAIRTVQRDDTGLFVHCRSGHHYLDGQTDESGEIIGLFLHTEGAMRAYRRLLRGSRS